MVEVTTINAFQRGDLKGNPAGVCLLKEFTPDEKMQIIARQMGHAETAFLVRCDPQTFILRWFTPTTEVPLCGHATLAAAHWLREQKMVDATKPVQFITLSGMIDARYDGAVIHLTLPLTPGEEQTVTPNITACLGVPVVKCMRSAHSYLVEVADVATLQNCAPNLEAIANLDAEDLIVTAKTEDGYDYAYRCFCPQVGIDEDQVTGSANCILAPYWATKLNKETMRAIQLSANGGALEVTLHSDRVEVGGIAETVTKIELSSRQLEAA